MASLKYLRKFWRTLEMSLINCEINHILTLPANWFIVDGVVDGQVPIPVVTLSTQDNPKLFQQLKSDFKSTINWNKYQSKATTQT